jgi:hypothetical protein
MNRVATIAIHGTALDTVMKIQFTNGEYVTVCVEKDDQDGHAGRLLVTGSDPLTITPKAINACFLEVQTYYQMIGEGK